MHIRVSIAAPPTLAFAIFGHGHGRLRSSMMMLLPATTLCCCALGESDFKLATSLKGSAACSGLGRGGDGCVVGREAFRGVDAPDVVDAGVLGGSYTYCNLYSSYGG